MVQAVAELVALGGEVAPVLDIRRHLDRHLLADAKRPKPSIPWIFFGLFVRMRIESQAEIGEDLGADPVLAHIRGEAELEVGLGRVEALLLELVGSACSAGRSRGPPGRGRGARRAPRATIRRRARSSCSPQSQRSEWKTSPVRHSEWTRTTHLGGPVDVAVNERDVVLAGQLLAVGDRRELAVGGRQPHRRLPLDQLLVLVPVLDQVGDRDHLQPVPLAVRDEVAQAGHRPVLVHDLADDAGRDAGPPAAPGRPTPPSGRPGGGRRRRWRAAGRRGRDGRGRAASTPVRSPPGSSASGRRPRCPWSRPPGPRSRS